VSFMFARTCDAIEDLTRCVQYFRFRFLAFSVSPLTFSQDIFDRDQFWHKELVKANQDRLCGCWVKTLDKNQSGVKNTTVHSLVAISRTRSSNPSRSKESIRGAVIHEAGWEVLGQME
jgi:hypothetical protein